MGAVTAGPREGVLSHQSAVNLHGLGELVNDRITFITPLRRTGRDPDLWFKTTELTGPDITLIESLPVTTLLRTICDLLDRHIDGSHIATIIREGVITNMVGLDELANIAGATDGMPLLLKNTLEASALAQRNQLDELHHAITANTDLGAFYAGLIKALTETIPSQAELNDVIRKTAAAIDLRGSYASLFEALRTWPGFFARDVSGRR